MEYTAIRRLLDAEVFLTDRTNGDSFDAADASTEAATQLSELASVSSPTEDRCKLEAVLSR